MTPLDGNMYDWASINEDFASLGQSGECWATAELGRDFYCSCFHAECREQQDGGEDEKEDGERVGSWASSSSRPWPHIVRRGCCREGVSTGSEACRLHNGACWSFEV